MYSVQDDVVIHAGFPHSDISGSQFVCKLPKAFRMLQRPSSPLTAKASTVCAYSLDHITRIRLYFGLCVADMFADVLLENDTIEVSQLCVLY